MVAILFRFQSIKWWMGFSQHRHSQSIPIGKRQAGHQVSNDVIERNQVLVLPIILQSNVIWGLIWSHRSFANTKLSWNVQNFVVIRLISKKVLAWSKVFLIEFYTGSKLHWWDQHQVRFSKLTFHNTRIILCVHPANERLHYAAISSLIGWAHTQNDPCNTRHCIC